MTLTANEDDDQFGRKMYLVLCLQRGLLQEALKTAQKISETEPNHPTVKELIRYVMHTVYIATVSSNDCAIYCLRLSRHRAGMSEAM